jgi:hypothetical protein
MTTDITAVEADGQFYVNVSLDGHDKQYGPYSTADEAEIMAARMGAICRGVFHQQVAIGVVPRSASCGSRRQGAGLDMEDSANGRSG